VISNTLRAAIFALCSIAIGVALATGHVLVGLVPVVFLGALWAHRAPASALIAAIWIAALRPIATQTLGVPRELALMADIMLIAALIGILLGRRSHDHRPSSSQRGVLVGMASFLLVAGISTAVNQSSLVDTVGATRALLLGPIAYLVGVEVSTGHRERQALQQNLLAVLLLECVLAMLQFPLAAQSSNPDLVVGTFGSGGANVLGLFCLVGVAFVASLDWLPTKRAVTLALLLTIPIVFSSSRLSMLLLPFVWLVVYWSRIRTGGLRLLLLLVSAILGIAIVSAYAVSTGRSPADDFDLGVITRGQIEVKAGNVPRLAYFKYIEAPLSARPWGWVIGLGPGQFASGYAISRGAPNAANLLSTLRVTATGYTSGGYTYLNGEIPVTSQLASTLSEYGLVGLIAYAGILISILSGVRKLPSRTDRVFILLAAGGTLVGSVWANLWELQTWMMVWAMLSISRVSNVE
jgi:hypothetical protein